jgi:hypothetical protein
LNTALSGAFRTLILNCWEKPLAVAANEKSRINAVINFLIKIVLTMLRWAGCSSRLETNNRIDFGLNQFLHNVSVGVY